MLSILPSLAPGHGGFAGGHKKPTKQIPALLNRVEEPGQFQMGKICRPGRVLGGVADPEVGAEVVSLDTVPEAPKTTHNINDNYCVVDQVPVARSLNVAKCVKNKNISVNAQVNVSCPVVGHVPSAISFKRQSQKKDVRPLSNIKKERKSVKSVFCRSLCLCPQCVKCPQCCTCSASGRSPAKLEYAEMVRPGCKSKGSVDLKGRLHSTFQSQTSSSERSADSQWLCKPHQEPEGSFACTDAQEGSREGEGSNLSSLLQQTLHSSKTKSKMTPNLQSQCSEQILSVTPEMI